MRTNRNVKDGLVGSVGSRADTVKQYKKFENKCNKDLKDLNKKKRMLYRISKKPGSRRQIKNINKIREISSNKSRHYSSNSFGNYSNSDSLLSSNSS